MLVSFLFVLVLLLSISLTYRGYPMVNRSIVRGLLISLSLLFLQSWVFPTATLMQSPNPANVDTRQETFANGQILVRFREGATSLSLLTAAQQFDLRQSSSPCAEMRVQAFSVRPGTELTAIEMLKADPAVEFAEPDYFVFAAPIDVALRQTRANTKTVLTPTTTTMPPMPPDDRLYDRQWALPKINALAAWAISSGSDVTIAVLDSGVDVKHPDLAARIVRGYDFVNNDDNADDDNGHGTHVAGIAAAISNNGIGIAGLAWNANIMPLKILNRSGVGTSSDLVRAICWAVTERADIINMSLGSPFASYTMKTAVDYAISQGIVLFAATGNLYHRGNPITYPAAYKSVIAVAATDRDDLKAEFSNTGTYVDIAAPGVDILSTDIRADQSIWAYKSGTSMSSAYAAGLAALILSVNPDLSPDQLKTVITDSVVDLGCPGRDIIFGYGRIDVAAALSVPTPMPTPTPGVCTTAPGTLTPTPTLTSTSTLTPTPTLTPMPTPTLTPTSTPTPTLTSTPTPTLTPTPTMPPGGNRQIAAGAEHTCALTNSGGVKCWGRNNYGQLGDGTTTDRLTPADVSGLAEDVQSIEAGAEHTCALTASGGVMCWGRNDYGQLGDGTTTDRLTPVEVNGLAEDVQSIEAGAEYTCALTANGDTMCWGRNDYGQLGDGTTTDRLTPVEVSDLAVAVQAIAAGPEHSCALTSGDIRCWGGNGRGQLGDGTTTDRLTPVEVGRRILRIFLPVLQR